MKTEHSCNCLATLAIKHLGLCPLHKAALELMGALKALYLENADYIKINNLGDIHHNQTMRDARAALAKAGGKE